MAQAGGKPQPLQRAEWSPDGGRIAATVHPDADVVVWDADSDDSGVVMAARGERFAFSPDGTRLLILMASGRCALCDVSTGEQLEEFALGPTYGPRSIDAILWHPHDSTVTLIRRSPGVGAFPYVWVESWSADSQRPSYASARWEARRRSAGDDRNAPPPLGRWAPDGETFAFAAGTATVELLTARGYRQGGLAGHSAAVYDIAWHPDGVELATGSADATIHIWNRESRRTTFVLEGHTAGVRACQYSADGKTLGTLDGNGEVRIWDTEAWSVRHRFTLDSPGGSDEYVIVRFHPRDPQRIAISSPERDRLELRTLEPHATRGAATHRHYVNATVLLVGDSGVGKSGLGLVLTGNDFKPTESTHNRWIWVLDATEAQAGEHQEIREVFLWDLAGQPGYRLIHQLHLSHADVALVVFDARSETDPFGGARYWARALRQIEHAAGVSKPVRFLVAARSDRGSVAVRQARIDEFMATYGFAQYFETSAKEGWNIEELADAIRAAIPWDRLPRVSSSDLFLSIKSFLVSEKEAGKLLAIPGDLLTAYRRAAIDPEFLRKEVDHPLWRNEVEDDDDPVSGERFLRRALGEAAESDELFKAFDTCIGRVASQGLIHRLSFGGLVLLQPELLDGYASAIVDAARREPDGLGTIAEDDVLTATFRMPEDERAPAEDERLLVIATVEELLRAEIALREHTENGSFLVFPSALTREWPETPEVPDLTTKFSIEGSIANAYATLVVRLSRSGRFAVGTRWQNGTTFEANTGGTCGIVVREEEARGDIGVFYSEETSEETRFQFEEFVQAHLERRVTHGTVVRGRLFVCGNPDCREPLSEGQVAKRRSLGHRTLSCPVCEQPVSLADWLEDRADRVSSVVPEMDDAADRERERQANVAVLEGKRATDDFDVFLCHNSRDKDEVKTIGAALQEHGVLPWLDEWELRPGVPWQVALEDVVENIKSAAVFIGPSGVGPWQDLERQAFLNQFVRRGCPVIPVLLESAPAQTPKLPTFLANMTWVDFRKADPDPLERLVWGVTGKRPLRP